MYCSSLQMSIAIIVRVKLEFFIIVNYKCRKLLVTFEYPCLYFDQLSN